MRQNRHGIFTIYPRNVPNDTSSNTSSQTVPDEITNAMKDTMSNYPEGVLAHEFLTIVRVS